MENFNDIVFVCESYDKYEKKILSESGITFNKLLKRIFIHLLSFDVQRMYI